MKVDLICLCGLAAIPVCIVALETLLRHWK